MSNISSIAEKSICENDCLNEQVNPVSTARLWIDKYLLATSNQDGPSQEFLATALLQWRNTVQQLPKTSAEVDHLRAILRSLRANDEGAYHLSRRVIFGPSRVVNFNIYR